MYYNLTLEIEPDKRPRKPWSGSIFKVLTVQKNPGKLSPQNGSPPKSDQFSPSYLNKMTFI